MNPGPGSGTQGRGGASGSGGNTSRGRGRGETNEPAPRLLRSNSTSTQSGAHVNMHSPIQTHSQPRSSPIITSHPQSNISTQPPIDNWLSNPSSSSGLFGPSRFQPPIHGIPQVPMYGHPPADHTTQFGIDMDFSELKTIMLSVQSSIKNMETRFSQFEKSLEDVKESNRKLVESQTEINDNVKELTDRVEKLETDLKSSEEKKERLEAQSRCENLRVHGLPDDRGETWDETEDKVRQYISKNLNLDQSSISIE